MTKQQTKLYNKVHKHYRFKMGIFWFNMFKKIKPIKAYGFWVDSVGSEDRVFIPHQLPYDYVIDIFCDMVAISKVHYKKVWATQSAQNYYTTQFKEKLLLHERSQLLLKTLLRILAESKNERDFFKWYKEMKPLIKVIY